MGGAHQAVSPRGEARLADPCAWIQAVAGIGVDRLSYLVEGLGVRASGEQGAVDSIFYVAWCDVSSVCVH